MSVIQFKAVGNPDIKRSTFELEYEHLTTLDMGELIPIQCDEVVPGDIIKMINTAIVRMFPIIAPILHEINLDTYTFFVANRTMFPKPNEVWKGEVEHPTEAMLAISDNKSWENFRTGGKMGDDTTTLPLTIPDMNDLKPGSLWDHLGLPMEILPSDSAPNAWAIRAYNYIWNEYFRDQNLMDWVDLDDKSLKYACWEKDYFTIALPFQQRGTSPAIPLSGLGSVDFTGSVPFQSSMTYSPDPWDNYSGLIAETPVGNANPTINFSNVSGNSPMNNPVTPMTVRTTDGGGTASFNTMYLSLGQDFKNWIQQNEFNLGEITTADINFFRLAFQRQKAMERNARVGFRFIEVMEGVFGVHTGDARVQRPEFIGATRTPIIISEVLQTAQSGTPTGGQPNTALGTMAGHGLSVSKNHVGTYRVVEDGWIMTVAVIRPRTSYSQGIEVQHTRRTRDDYFRPEYVNLSEQAVYNRELMATQDETYNSQIFGYQGRYNELRYKTNKVSGLMRKDFAHWHLSRVFDPTSTPQLNAEFVTCKPDKRIFAVTNEPGFILNFGINMTAIRPIPIMPEPGMVDHH